MNDFLALDLSGAGMQAQRLRMQVVAENLANQHTIGPKGPYQRREVVFEATPAANFEKDLESASRGIFDNEAIEDPQSVKVSRVQTDKSEPVRVHDPANPMADAQGYVSYPNISIFREMADMVEASRSYEANLAASKTSQEMLLSAIDLIKK